LLFFGSREADGFSPESIDRAEEFANRIVFPIQRALLEEELRRLAFTDAQTSLFNHRHFQTLLDEEIRRAQRYGRPLSIIFLDLDSFKAFNDTYGHPAGDTLLREVSGVLRANLRAVDMAARYGGEEFVVILPETAGEQAAVLAERLREAVEQMEVCVEEGRVPHVTVSVGVASFPANAQTKSELIEAADKAQYEAKTSGKNRVVQAGS
jgi:diguanylate cyclase (GGDEF)-like protein